jgi:GNAT superfamily N-acetyltransferase
VTVTIRAVTIDDSEDIARLSGQLGYPSEADVIRRRLQFVLASPETAVIAAVVDTRVVGWMQLSVMRQVESEPFAEIRGLVVDESVRGSGIGSLLVNHARDWANANGCSRLRVRTNVTRFDTHQFYERRGFRLSKTQKVYETGLSSDD